MGGGRGGSFGNTKGNALDTLSIALSAAGLIPVVGISADLAATVVDALRGDYLGSALSLLSAVPFVGEAAGMAKIAKVADTIHDIDKAKDVLKVADKLSDAAKVSNKIDNISTTKLIVTHRPTLSKKQFSTLLNDIKRNGIKESIKYVEYSGQKYVVDGHHRLKAAKQLNIENVPTEKVTLPYKGYKTINDLLWFD